VNIEERDELVLSKSASECTHESGGFDFYVILDVIFRDQIAGTTCRDVVLNSNLF
jgi:hypothetical protein